MRSALSRSSSSFCFAFDISLSLFSISLYLKSSLSFAASTLSMLSAFFSSSLDFSRLLIISSIFFCSSFESLLPRSSLVFFSSSIRSSTSSMAFSASFLAIWIFIASVFVLEGRRTDTMTAVRSSVSMHIALGLGRSLTLILPSLAFILLTASLL